MARSGAPLIPSWSGENHFFHGWAFAMGLAAAVSAIVVRIELKYSSVLVWLVGGLLVNPGLSEQRWQDRCWLYMGGRGPRASNVNGSSETEIMMR